MTTETSTHRIRCAHCRDGHPTAREVRDCAWEQEEGEANARAEALAEQRAERYWEEGSDAQQALRAAEAQYEEQLFGWGDRA